jgi:hypothetical protein
MTALTAAPRAEKSALARDTLVTTAGFRRSDVKRAKCFHNIVECDWSSSFYGNAAQFRYGVHCASIRCP